MTLEAFAPSQPLTLGVELELQLLSTHDYDLTPYAADMLRLMASTADLPGTRGAGDDAQHDRNLHRHLPGRGPMRWRS